MSAPPQVEAKVVLLGSQCSAKRNENITSFLIMPKEMKMFDCKNQKEREREALDSDDLHFLFHFFLISKSWKLWGRPAACSDTSTGPSQMRFATPWGPPSSPRSCNSPPSFSLLAQFSPDYFFPLGTKGHWGEDLEDADLGHRGAREVSVNGKLIPFSH